ncbi:MAG: terminase large subunit [Parasphingorhabdus sp.]
MDWSTACPDWEERIVAKRSLIPFDPLFPEVAADALAVFKSLKIVDAPGMPTFGEACEEWVFDFVGLIFGAYDPKSAMRLINEFMLLISKKNSKSTIAAGIMLTALIVNWRNSAELLILAPTLEIAKNSFDPAADMVEHDEELKQLLHVQEHLRTITHRVTKAELKVVAADKDTVGGKKAGFVLVDELWLFGKKPRAKAMLREATGGLASRPEGFVVYLTTHSDEPPEGEFKDKLEYFRDVRDGVIEDKSCFGLLYEFPRQMLEDEAYLEPENFYITNPNLGKSVSQKYLETEFNKEMRGDGEGKQLFFAKHLNVEIGMRLRRDRWRAAEYWDQCGDKALTLESLVSRSEVIVAGVDGGGLDDLYGLAVLGRCRDTGKWLYWAKAWAQPIVLDRRKDIATSLHGFESDGDLVICDDPAQDIDEISEILIMLSETGLLPEKSAIGLDPQGVSDLVDLLEDGGVETEQITGVGQGYRLSSATWAMERRLFGKRMVHAGSAMMAWCVSNARVKDAGNGVLLTKQESGRAKIDPLCACLNATKLMEMNPEAAGRSVYETRGLVVIG